MESLASLALVGVRPVLSADERLAEALADHADNPHVYDAVRTIKFRDDLFEDVATDQVSSLLSVDDVTRSAAVRRIVGWLDAGNRTQRAARVSIHSKRITT